MKKRAVSGLTAIFFGDLATNHFFGAFIYTLPWYAPRHGYILTYSIDQVAEGFSQATYGLLGFFFGSLAMLFLYKPTKLPRMQSLEPPPSRPKALICFGIFFYFILSPLQKISGLGTISQSGWILMQIGVCLALLKAYEEKKQGRFFMWLTGGVIFFPCFTLLVQGFLGYAIKVLLNIFCFIGTFYRPKWRLIVAIPLLLYLGLTIYVNYMPARDELRAQVWQGGAFDKRMEVLKKIRNNWRVFNIRDSEQLELVDLRLNQNVFVGSAVDYLRTGYQSFAHGKTLITAFQAMMPRLLWPGKPIIGGSGDLVTDYTGLELSEESSFGIGFPLELYINFGTQSVVMGFIFLGIVIGWYDYRAGSFLATGHTRQFLFYFFPGLALTNTIGSLSEATSSFAGAYVFLLLIDRLYLRREYGRRQGKLQKVAGANSTSNSVPRAY